METVVRNVTDIDARDRQALEHVLGTSLQENQQLVIGIVSRDLDATPPLPPDKANGTPTLPDWCNVYEGLSDEEIADIEKIVLQRAGVDS